MSNLFYKKHWKKKSKFLKMSGMSWILNGKVLRTREFRFNHFKQNFNFKKIKILWIQKIINK